MSRYIVINGSNADTEAGRMPPQSLIEGVGRMVGETLQNGTFRDAAGLLQSARGVRLVFSGGKRTVTEGPFTPKREVTAAMCILRVHSRDEVVEWASRFAAIIGDAEIDIRPVTEAWDLGFQPKPEGLTTTRFMAVLKADKRFESGERPSKAVKDAVGKLVAEMKQAGVFLAAEVLAPSARGKRIRSAGGKVTVVDGPFTESKELMSGFVLLELPSFEEAVAWAHRYSEVLVDVQLEVRAVRELAEL